MDMCSTCPRHLARSAPREGGRHGIGEGHATVILFVLVGGEVGVNIVNMHRARPRAPPPRSQGTERMTPSRCDLPLLLLASAVGLIWCRIREER